MFTTQTSPELVKILGLGPAATPWLKRIGYWRSVPGDGKAGVQGPSVLGTAPLVAGGPYTYQAESTHKELASFDAGAYSMSASGTGAYVKVSEHGNRYVPSSDVLRGTPEVARLQELYKTDKQAALDGFEELTFTAEQLRAYLSEECDSALIKLKAWRELPWPGDHLDAELAQDERERVATALRSFPIVASYCGNAASRLTPKATCGGCERANDEWIWPVGLAHYVRDHGLALDPDFLGSLGEG